MFIIIYRRTTFFDKDIGFGALVWLFKYYDFKYIYLKTFVAIVGLIMINSTAKVFLKDSKLFYLLYFIFEFFFDVVQVRNFLAMSVFIYAIKYLVDDSTLSKIK